MTAARRQAVQRPPRADAQRNRERILDVARDAFTRLGAGASLDGIAQGAGVGAGTLYRHFPTRAALLDAVYRSEIERLAASDAQYAALPPADALRTWLVRFVEAIATKQIILPELLANPDRLATDYERSHARIHEAVRRLAKRAVKSGTLRKDVDPVDLLRALLGVAHGASDRDWRLRAMRLVDILLAGARPENRVR
jgi:AcrR family transcriptional regulator